MSADVIPILGGTKPGEPFPDLIQELERLLTEAKEGKLQALAYVTWRSDGETGTGWTGSAGSRNAIAMGVMLLNYRYAQGVHDGGSN